MSETCPHDKKMDISQEKVMYLQLSTPGKGGLIVRIRFTRNRALNVCNAIKEPKTGFKLYNP